MQPTVPNFNSYFQPEEWREKGESRLKNKRRPGSDWGSISICDREQFFRRETSDELGEKLALSCSLFHAASRNKVFKVDCRNFGRPKSSSPPEYVWVKLKPGFCFFPGSLMSYARKFWSVGQPSWLSRLTQDGNNTWGILTKARNGSEGRWHDGKDFHAWTMCIWNTC